MRASSDTRLVFLGLAASLVLAGCGKGSEQASPEPPPLTGDAGVSRTVRVDTAVGAGDGTGVVTAVDGSGDSSAGASRDAVDAVGDASDAAGDGVRCGTLAAVDHGYHRPSIVGPASGRRRPLPR